MNGAVIRKIEGKNNPGCRQEDEHPGKHELSPNGPEHGCLRMSAACELRSGMWWACCFGQAGGDRKHGRRTERPGWGRLILSGRLCRHLVDVCQADARRGPRGETSWQVETGGEAKRPQKWLADLGVPFDTSFHHIFGRKHLAVPPERGEE